MTLHYTDDHLAVYVGDCRTILRELPAESVHCVVTSPPYWGLRDYGTASWTGGDEGHQHLGSQMRTMPPGSDKQASNFGALSSGDCECGATRIDSQLGLEPTPEAYVASMVEVFREVRRVLRADGTVWLNLGDSYASHDPGGYRPGEFLNPGGRVSAKERAEFKKREYAAVQDIVAGSVRNRAGNYRPGGLKPKDLVGIPWRLAFALQADGWYLRSDIIWSKPNPMPESVTDRPTKSHEYVFLLSKSARYFYDVDAVREPHRWQDADLLATNAQARQGLRLAQRRAAGDESAVRTQPPLGREKGRGKNGNAESEFSASSAGRNLRDVWTIATEPYPGAHFATFPQKLVEPCIKAGTSERGVCPECGAPWVREVERTSTYATSHDWRDRWPPTTAGHNTVQHGGITTTATTVGWRPSCVHDADALAHKEGWTPGTPMADGRWPEMDVLRSEMATVPATVLDPFAGSGTTGLVANRLGRRAILIDLSADYIDQAMLRNQQAPLGLGA